MDVKVSAREGSVLQLAVFPPQVQALVRVVAELAAHRRGPVSLVGGAVRDGLLGRGLAVSDLDLAVPSGAVELGRDLADITGGTFVLLDEIRGTGRVVVEREGAGYRIDCTDYRRAGLVEDLRARDFTVDAMAVDLKVLCRDGMAQVVDPLGGINDLTARIIRACGSTVLSDDPVRALRGIRLACILEARVEDGTARLMAGVAASLPQVAAERIREELFLLFALAAGSKGLRLADRLGLLEVLFPEIGPMRTTIQTELHQCDAWEHSLRTVEGMEELLRGTAGLSPFDGSIRAHLGEEMEAGITRGTLLKFAALFHDVAKPQTKSMEGGRVRFIGHDKLGAAMVRTMARRLRLSGRSIGVLERCVLHHLRPMHLALAGEITLRARYRFYRDLGEEVIDVLMLSLADASGTCGWPLPLVLAGEAGALVRELLGGLVEDRRREATPPLVTGHDVMSAFGLAPGPAVGRLLALAREAQALGVVHTKEEALAHLAHHEIESPVSDSR